MSRPGPIGCRALSHYRQAVTKEKIGSARLAGKRRLHLTRLGGAQRHARLHALSGCPLRLVGRPRNCDLKARAYADRALELDPDNADGYIVLAYYAGERAYDEAVVDARKAVQLAPGSADVAELASFVLTPSGYPEEGVVQSEKAITLSPNHPPMYLGTLGNAYRLSGRIEEAIAAFKAYDARSPGFGLIDLVIAYQQNGQADKAKDAAKRLISARRDFTISAWLKTQFRRDRAPLEADVEALRAAGLDMG